MESSSMYKEHILELWKHPENFGELQNYTHKKRGFNETCGDDITIQLKMSKGKIDGVKFTGKGCALCVASASLVTEKIKGMKEDEVLSLGSKDVKELLEVEINPARLKCVLLPLETIQQSLREKR